MGVVDDFARQVGWKLSYSNVIVEGMSDLKLFLRASELHSVTYGVPIIDEHFRLCAAGKGDDGGVEGVNRMLVTSHQLASADRDPSGRQRYRFIGLVDNDPAGRLGIRHLTSFTSRLQKYRDIFALFPDMPVRDHRGMAYVQQEMKQLSKGMGNSRFEIEDLMSPKFLIRFEQLFPSAIIKKQEVASRFHYHFSGPGKAEFLRFALKEATAEDFVEFFAVAKALRSYLNVKHSQIGPKTLSHELS